MPGAQVMWRRSHVTSLRAPGRSAIAAGRLTFRLLGLVLALATVLTANRVEACAGCSNPNLPSSPTTQDSAAEAGRLTGAVLLTGTTLRIVHSEDCPEIGPICSVRVEPPQLHDQTLWVAELRAMLQYALTGSLGVEAQFPIRYTQTGITFRRLDGTPFEPDYENIHHRNESLFGVGDPWLTGRYSWKREDRSLVLHARAGFTLPVGRTEENPFRRAEEGLSHQHVQFGTGTINPVASLELKGRLDEWELGGHAQTILTFGENSLGYRAGNRFAFGVVGRGPEDWPIRPELTADLIHERPERWDGRIQQEGNVGRSDVLVGVGASRMFGEVHASLQVKTPVWQHFVEAEHRHGAEPTQLTYPAVVSLVLARPLGTIP